VIALLSRVPPRSTLFPYTTLFRSIVARIVDAHGGVLRIKSKAGAGTVMHVFLPRSSESAPVRLPGRDGAERRSSDPPLPIEVRRSEEHTSELQSQSNLVCRLLLEK